LAVEEHAYAIAACSKPLISKLHFNLNPPFVIEGVVFVLFRVA
jgi:hypothetical protein